MTVPAFRAATGIAQETSNPSLTIPSAVVAGDLMLLMCCAVNNNGVATPTGWTFERGDAGGNTSNLALLIAVYSRYATSGDPGSTLNLTIAGRNAVALSAYSGVRGSIPVAGVASSGQRSVSETDVSMSSWGSSLTQTQNTTLTAPSATPDSGDVRVVRLWLGGDIPGVSNHPVLTLPATSRTNHGGLVIAAALSDESSPGSGASGTNTATNSINGWWAATTILLGSVDLSGWTVGMLPIG